MVYSKSIKDLKKTMVADDRYYDRVSSSMPMYIPVNGIHHERSLSISVLRFHMTHCHADYLCSIIDNEKIELIQIASHYIYGADTVNCQHISISQNVIANVNTCWLLLR